MIILSSLLCLCHSGWGVLALPFLWSTHLFHHKNCFIIYHAVLNITIRLRSWNKRKFTSEIIITIRALQFSILQTTSSYLSVKKFRRLLNTFLPILGCSASTSKITNILQKSFNISVVFYLWDLTWPSQDTQDDKIPNKYWKHMHTYKGSH